MEYRKANPPYLTDTRVVSGELSQHYESIFASVKPVFIGSDENVFKFGYGAFVLVGRVLSIMQRLRKNAVDKWRDWVLRQAGQERFYKYIETPASTRFKLRALRSFENLQEIWYKRLSFAFGAIGVFIRIKRKVLMQVQLYKVYQQIQEQKFDCFETIKKLAYVRKVQNRFVKERILWSSLCIKNSKSFCVKIGFKKWKKWVSTRSRLLKVSMHEKITRFKNYDRMMMLKVIKAFFDSQSKKKCFCFCKWRETTRNISAKIRKDKTEDEENKKRRRDSENMEELEGSLLGHKEKLVQNQVESLLYEFAIDSLNGFLNL